MNEIITITAPPGTIAFDHNHATAVMDGGQIVPDVMLDEPHPMFPGVTAREAADALMTLARANALTAALAPLKPSRAWFERPESDELTPMTYLDSGEAFGHLAGWETCHAGLASGGFSDCLRPPRSQTDYARFHLGSIETAEGDMLSVGKIVLATGHASMSADLAAATKHYDNTGSVGAFVRASNGKHGIWASGAVRSDLSPEGLRDLRASPPSGDWRSFNHNLELVAALAVPVPGFPIPRSQLALAASGEISALILTEIEEEEPEARSKDYLRKKASITRRWK